MRYILAPWQWSVAEFGQPSEGLWVPPLACKNLVDLRPIPAQASQIVPEGHGLFSIPDVADLPVGATVLSTDMNLRHTAQTRTDMAAVLGVDSADLDTPNLGEAIWRVLTTLADPTGDNRVKPLTRNSRNMLSLKLPGWEKQFAAPSGGTDISESFNTADSDTLGPDLTWTEIVGDIDIVTNKAQSTVAGQAWARADTELASVNMYSQATCNESGGGNVDIVGTSVRNAAGAVDTHYDGVARRVTTLTWLIYKMVAGTHTRISDVDDTAPTRPHILRTEVDGSDVTLYEGDPKVQKDTVNDTAIDGVTVGGKYAGIGQRSSQTAGANWDDFTAGDINLAAGGTGRSSSTVRMHQGLNLGL